MTGHRRRHRHKQRHRHRHRHRPTQRHILGFLLEPARSVCRRFRHGGRLRANLRHIYAALAVVWNAGRGGVNGGLPALRSVHSFACRRCCLRVQPKLAIVVRAGSGCVRASSPAAVAAPGGLVTHPDGAGTRAHAGTVAAAGVAPRAGCSTVGAMRGPAPGSRCTGLTGGAST